MLFAGTVAAEYACYKLADQGLANLLGLKTLRHGTTLINYIGIKLLGGFPAAGGNRTGATRGWNYDNTSGKFYIFKDNVMTSMSQSLHGHKPSAMFTLFIEGFQSISIRILPNYFKFLGGYNTALSLFCLPHFNEIPYHSMPVLKILIAAIGTIGGLAAVLTTPTLKFRISPREVSQKFTNDPKFDGLAYYTTHWVAMWKIGVLGTLTQGLNLDIFKRIYDQPAKAVTGVFQIATAVALAKLGMTLYPTAFALTVPYAVPIAAGMMLFA